MIGPVLLERKLQQEKERAQSVVESIGLRVVDEENLPKTADRLTLDFDLHKEHQILKSAWSTLGLSPDCVATVKGGKVCFWRLSPLPSVRLTGMTAPSINPRKKRSTDGE